MLQSPIRPRQRPSITRSGPSKAWRALLFGAALLPVIALSPVSEAAQSARADRPVVAPDARPAGPLPQPADPNALAPALDPAEALPAVDLPTPPGNPSKAARDAYAKAGKTDKGEKQGVGSGRPVEAPPETSTETARTQADSAMTAAATTGCQVFGSYSVCPPLLDKYLQARAQGVVANPVSAMRCGLVNQGCGQDFAPDVSIYDPQWTVPSLVRGAIRAEWTRRVGADGGTAQNGPYGYPEGDETVVNDRPRSHFRKVVNGYYVGPHFPGDGNTGSIYCNRYTGRTTPVTGAIRVKWMDTGGGDNGWMGYPEDEATSAPVGLRLKQYFPGIGEWPASFIYGTGGSHGAHIVQGNYLDRYYYLNYEAGCLSYPRSDDRMMGSDTDPDGRWHGQDFERGRMKTSGDRNDWPDARCPGNPGGPRWRYLDHPVSVSSLITPTAQGILEGARYAQPGVAGEDFVDAGESVATAMGDLQQQFTEKYGSAATPLVVAVSLAPSASGTTVLRSQDATAAGTARAAAPTEQADAFLKELAAAPTAKPTKIDHAVQAEWYRRNGAAVASGPKAKTTTGTGTGSAPPQADSQTAAAISYPPPGVNPEFGPLWAPDKTFGGWVQSIRRPDEVTLSALHIWTRTGQSEGPDTRRHDPEITPKEWGIELDYSLFNDGQRQSFPPRPACLSKTSERDFFAAREGGPGRQVRSWDLSVQGSIPGSAGGGSAEDWGAYFDGNDALDNCGRLGFSIGIGNPTKLDNTLAPGADIRVYMTVYADKGDQLRSDQEVGYQVVSNDCPRYPVGDPAVRPYTYETKPASDCMGLWFNRPVPASLEGKRSSPVLNRQDRFISGDTDLFDAPGRWAHYSGLGTYPEAPFG